MATSKQNPQDPPTETLPEFHLFVCLPREIQIKIWKLAIPSGPRVIELYEVHQDGLWRVLMTSAPQRMLLPLLKTCHMSQTIVLENFRKVNCLEFGGWGMSFNSTFLVNYDTDRLFLNTEFIETKLILVDMQPEERALIQNFIFCKREVAISTSWHRQSNGLMTNRDTLTLQSLSRVLHTFPKLERISLVTNGRWRYWDKEVCQFQAFSDGDLMRRYLVSPDEDPEDLKRIAIVESLSHAWKDDVEGRKLQVDYLLLVRKAHEAPLGSLEYIEAEEWIMNQLCYQHPAAE